jgi:hypothetical protein
VCEGGQFKGYVRDSGWYPLRPEDCVVNMDIPNSGSGLFLAAAEDAPTYYWKNSDQTSKQGFMKLLCTEQFKNK